MNADAAMARATLLLGEAQSKTATAKQPDMAAAERAAKDFEAVFLAQMLAPMFAELGDDPLFGGGPGESVFKSLLIDEYAKSMAESGGTGVNSAVLRELINLQEM